MGDLELVEIREAEVRHKDKCDGFVVVGPSCDATGGGTLSLHNVMGQEDKFRQVSGSRVDNGGTARIVVSTTIASDIVDADYVANPANEDNPTFTDTWNPISNGTSFHEFFVGVKPNSLYAFQVTLQPSGGGSNKTTGIYYFQTGSIITVQSTGFEATVPTVTVIVPDDIFVQPVGYPNAPGAFKAIVGEGVNIVVSEDLSAEVTTASVFSPDATISGSTTEAFGPRIVTLAEKV